MKNKEAYKHAYKHVHYQKEIKDCQNLLDEGSSLQKLFMIVRFPRMCEFNTAFH